MFHYIACMTSFTLEAYLFETSINGYIINDLKSINELVKLKKSNSDIFKQLSTINFAHAKSKQLSE